MQKHRKILEYTISSLLRRKRKNLALIAVFSLVIGVLASILFLTHSFKVEALNVLSAAPELIVQKIVGGRHDLIPEHYMKKIEGIYGVGRVIPRYWGYYYDSVSDSNYTLMESGEDEQGLKLLDGRLPSEEGECAIGRGVSDKGIGSEIYLSNSKADNLSFTIVGVFRSDSALLTNDLVLLTKQDILSVFGMSPDRATDIIVEVYNESEVPFVARKIRNMLPDTRPITKSEIIRTYDTVFSWRSGMIITMFSGALIAFCILAWDKATGLSAEEKQEIGILKAIGWETSDILELKFWEGLVISLTSFLTGIILAYVHVFFFSASLIAPALKGWSTIFPSFELDPQINLYHVFTMFFLTIIPYIASTIIPSWKSAVTDPDTVMRG
jgi:ABC-type lipoprotein release transport system permease subunit